MSKENTSKQYNIIFLDVDGVLNNKANLLKTHDVMSLDPQSVSLIRALVAETEAKVVLSSSWRFSQSYVAYLEESLRFQFLDVTPKNRMNTRGANIREWLEIYCDSIKGYVIIDDENDDIRDIDHFVKTSFETGFTKVHYDKALKILSRLTIDDSNSNTPTNELEE